MDRWKEYNAGKLKPPCVVQHDVVRDEHLIWVWDGVNIQGPFSRTKYDEVELLVTAMTVKDTVIEPVLDAKELIIAEKETEIVALKIENTKLKEDLAAAVDVKPVADEPIEGEAP